MKQFKEAGRIVCERNPGNPEVSHPAFSGRIGIARGDITPPVEIYSRNWGAAKHDQAESIHKPLNVTAISLASEEHSTPLVLLDFDLGWWRKETLFQSFQKKLLDELSLKSPELIIAFSHTHAGAAFVDEDPLLPGSELVENYLQHILQTAIDTARLAIKNETEAILDWHTGRCDLASNRDFIDPTINANRIVCGYNPHGKADDTLLVGRVTNKQGTIIATLVNYACHPTTLAWENKTISPDYIGAMRETIETATNAPALFLQGVSGELSPRYQYVGDTAVADRHGRQLGYSALATLEAMEPPATKLVFDSVMESGAPLAVWRHQKAVPSKQLQACESSIELPLKDWPSAEELEKQQLACEDRTVQERLRRKLAIRRGVGDGQTYSLPVYTWQIGDVVLVGSKAEAYSILQTELRSRFPEQTLVCMNLINGSIGYLAPRELYDKNIYQVWQTPFASGSLEATIEGATQILNRIFEMS